MALRWIGYLACLAGCAGFHLFYGQWLSWVVLLVCLLVPWLSLAVSLAAMVTFRPELEMPGSVQMGQEAVCTLAAGCAMPLPPYTGVLRARCRPSGGSLTGRGVLTLPTAHCGAVTVAASRVRVTDYLGLFFCMRRLPGEKTLLVRPQPVPLAHVPGRERLRPRAWQPKPGGGYGENHELRSYRPGDSLNQVHWKLSAKMGQLVLRQTMEPKRGLVLVSLDLGGTPEELDRKLWPVLVLLLSAHARRCHIPSGSRLAAWLALPVGMVLAVLFFLVPRDGYVDRTAALRQRLITWGQEIGQQIGQQVSMPQEPDAPAQPSAPQQVDLWDQGQRQESRQPVLYVTAQTGGALYLRGQDYDVYDGRAWHATPHRAEPFAMEGASLGRVTVQTLGLEREVYLPYYPEPGTVLVGGRLENTRLQTEYTCQRRSITQSLDALLEQGAEQTVTSGWPEYLALPEKTRQGLQGYVAGLSGQATDKALAIGRLVRQTASYDLQTERMPQDAEDFALWFLEQSDRGYCVHFATAAVVLLRAAGVEARYVSGYLVNLRPDTRTAVTGEHAHAWAEYYEPALGNWLILEATPGAEQPQPPVAAEDVRPEPQTLPPAQLPQGRPEEDLTIPQGQQPEPSLPAQPQKSRGRSPLPWILAAGLLAAAVLEGQRRLRLSWRNRPRQPNDRALVLWRQAEQLAFCLRRSVPQSLEALALKARFSQHTLTPQELAQMEAYCQTAVQALKDRPWYVRLAARYGFALY